MRRIRNQYRGDYVSAAIAEELIKHPNNKKHDFLFADYTEWAEKHWITGPDSMCIITYGYTEKAHEKQYKSRKNGGEAAATIRGNDWGTETLRYILLAY